MKKEIKCYIHKTQYYETDQMGIIHHSNYIRWFEEARIDFLEQIGYSYNRLETEGIFSPVLKVYCEYRSMIKFNDIVEVRIVLAEASPYKFAIKYELVDRPTGEIKAVGESWHCYINKAGKPVSVKKENIEFFNRLREYKE